ncbi:MAG: 3-mercaptopyruvate sulfurtransferase [Alphaproteobacteria bacterium]
MADYINPDALVSTDWLAAHLDVPDIRIVDASWYLPAEKRDPKAEFLDAHIPGAVFFDIDDISDTDQPLPHMVASPIKFSFRVRKLGLGDGNRIVAYDSAGLFSAARVWWNFRYMGHTDVAVLDGGLPKWIKEGRPLERGSAHPRERHFTPRANSFLVRDVGQMLANIASRRDQVIDVRSAGRFHARDPEPRPGLRSGHIPGALNLPYPNILDPAEKTMLPADRLRAAFDRAGIDPTRPSVTSCGSGITAAIMALGMYLLGNKEVAVYDGSWTEWGVRADTPIET